MGGKRDTGPPERRLTPLANRQYGVVSRDQLLELGLSHRAIERRVEVGRLLRLHYGVYAVGHEVLPIRGRWLAAVLTFAPGAVLSHRSAAALWGLMRPGRGSIDVTVVNARSRAGIALHRSHLRPDERTTVDRIPTTTVARTLFDFAEVADEDRLRRAAEEADRLRVLSLRDLDVLCTRLSGRRAVAPIRRLIGATQKVEDTQSPLEDRVLGLCRAHDLPPPVTGAAVLGKEVDAFWPAAKLMIEADSWQHHGHRAAFERDRDRDAAMQVEGYRVIRLTHRRMKREPAAVADQIRRLLKAGV